MSLWAAEGDVTRIGMETTGGGRCLSRNAWNDRTETVWCAFASFAHPRSKNGRRSNGS